MSGGPNHPPRPLQGWNFAAAGSQVPANPYASEDADLPSFLPDVGATAMSRDMALLFDLSFQNTQDTGHEMYGLDHQGSPNGDYIHPNPPLASERAMSSGSELTGSPHSLCSADSPLDLAHLRESFGDSLFDTLPPRDHAPAPPHMGSEIWEMAHSFPAGYMEGEPRVVHHSSNNNQQPRRASFPPQGPYVQQQYHPTRSVALNPGFPSPVSAYGQSALHTSPTVTYVGRSQAVNRRRHPATPPSDVAPTTWSTTMAGLSLGSNEFQSTAVTHRATSQRQNGQRSSSGHPHRVTRPSSQPQGHVSAAHSRQGSIVEARRSSQSSARVVIHQRRSSSLTSAPETASSATSTHMRAQERKYVCTIDGCGQSFALQKDLDRHQTKTDIHRGQRMFFCPVQGCEMNTKGQSRQDNLKRHIRKKHPGVPDS